MEPAATVMSGATPSCCYDFSSSSPPAGEEYVVFDGSLPAGVQPLFDFNRSSSSIAPAAQTGFLVVDGPSPADGLGSHASAATAEMSPDSAHTHRDPPSSVCSGTGCTGSSSDESAAGRPIFQISARVLCYTRYCFCANLDGNVKTGPRNTVSQMLPQQYTTYFEYRLHFVLRVQGV